MKIKTDIANGIIIKKDDLEIAIAERKPEADIKTIKHIVVRGKAKHFQNE